MFMSKRRYEELTNQIEELQGLAQSALANRRLAELKQEYEVLRAETQRLFAPDTDVNAWARKMKAAYPDNPFSWTD